MFLINSRRPLVCATFLLRKHPFSRSYGVNLPSSFNMVLSSALVYSTCSPVSVWGTGKKSRSFFLEVASLILFSSDCKCSSESKHSKLRHSRVPIALHPFGVDLGAANEEVFKQTLLLFLSLCVD